MRYVLKVGRDYVNFETDPDTGELDLILSPYRSDMTIIELTPENLNDHGYPANEPLRLVKLVSHSS